MLLHNSLIETIGCQWKYVNRQIFRFHSCDRWASFFVQYADALIWELLFTMVHYDIVMRGNELKAHSFCITNRNILLDDLVNYYLTQMMLSHDRENVALFP